MARVNFVRTFQWFPLAPSKTTFTEYLAGNEYTVTRKCAEQAIDAGAGIEIKPPRRRKRAEDAG